MQPLIDIRGLTYSYEDGTEALSGINFQLMPEETVILFGANGSGKTTFLLHLNGLLQGLGQISICGLDLSAKNMTQIRSRVGMVFQDSDEQLFMPTVLEDVAFGPLHQGLSAVEAELAARSALKSVDINGLEHRAPYHLSAGEKKRVAIAGVLAMKPDIVVLDEPTTFLDPPGQRGLIQILRSLPQAKIIATHDTCFAQALGTRAVFFEKGKIKGAGSVNQLMEQFSWRPSDLETT